ncbi:hypothetical protein [Bradyrhizobium sp. sGM-13]|uniref:hypothetical protein n=1 Tax=Bradyrhizobium sp. sGM-13 TaxID=2831781 RepID=UPI001BCC5D95|nr:hypothetical protein [Bradyrhizobium sp. sGM-13]
MIDSTMSGYCAHESVRSKPHQFVIKQKKRLYTAKNLELHIEVAQSEPKSTLPSRKAKGEGVTSVKSNGQGHELAGMDCKRDNHATNEVH